MHRMAGDRLCMKRLLSEATSYLLVVQVPAAHLTKPGAKSRPTEAVTRGNNDTTDTIPFFSLSLSRSLSFFLSLSLHFSPLSFKEISC